MNDPDTDTLDLPDHLLPIDQLLRDACSRATFPDPPDHLCHQTLERCFASVTVQATERT
jgi:hypothetical protein